MSRITVIKQNHTGMEMWRYRGKLLSRAPHRIVLEAFFDRDDYPVHDILLRRGDRFVETYFDDRWYNIHHIFDREDGRRKAWYCNIGRPATFEDNVISYQDLALDLLILPDGKQHILDEQEFEDLDLDEKTRTKARRALAELQSLFSDTSGMDGKEV
jgi:uncharacterized protein